MAIVIAIGATHRITIGDNGASIGAINCRHWRQWRQMIHSPNLMTLLPNFKKLKVRTEKVNSLSIQLTNVDDFLDVTAKIINNMIVDHNGIKWHKIMESSSCFKSYKKTLKHKSGMSLSHHTSKLLGPRSRVDKMIYNY